MLLAARMEAFQGLSCPSEALLCYTLLQYTA